MKRLFRLCLFIAFCFVFAPIVHAEEIRSFDDVVTINSDGTIDVHERIVYDFEQVYRHGIFRTIPFVKTNNDGKRYQMDFSKFSVVDQNGKSYRFSKATENTSAMLKIGDPNRTISGAHQYDISYHVSGAITYFSDHDELYWNITGNEWEVPIDGVRASIQLPRGITGDPKVVCFIGEKKSTESDCSIKVSNQTVQATSNRRLEPYEGLTIAVGFPKNIVAVMEPKEYKEFWETTLGKILSIIIFIAITIIALLWYVVYPIWLPIKWYRHGRDPRALTGVAKAWFDAPKTRFGRSLMPGETGALVDEEVDLRDIYATIVDLARRGYIKIIETKKNDFTLSKQEKDVHELLSFERTFLNGIFEDNTIIRIKDAKLFDLVEKTKNEIYNKLVSEGFFSRNPSAIRKFYTGVAATALMTINFPLLIIATIFGRNMPKKTLLGAQETNVAMSLKNFLTSQDKKLEFQARNQMFFEKLLPYAVAFGVEKVWADRFKDINLKEPDWYQGYNSTSSFRSMYFVQNLGNSFSSIHTAATPTSSSSGFSSGFSGGSSGGGGGGGGGGSW